MTLRFGNPSDRRSKLAQSALWQLSLFRQSFGLWVVGSQSAITLRLASQRISAQDPPAAFLLCLILQLGFPLLDRELPLVVDRGAIHVRLHAPNHAIDGVGARIALAL